MRIRLKNKERKRKEEKYSSPLTEGGQPTEGKKKENDKSGIRTHASCESGIMAGNQHYH